jgi:hypothetical protein
VTTRAQTVHSITGNQFTAGTAEETVLLTKDGATPAASISVPTNTDVAISDVIVGGVIQNSMWRLQQTNDGATFFDIALFNITNATVVATPIHTFNTGLVINGGANVAFRLRVTTPASGGSVIATLRSYSEQ